jgi:hypothetical protein
MTDTDNTEEFIENVTFDELRTVTASGVRERENDAPACSKPRKRILPFDAIMCPKLWELKND